MRTLLVSTVCIGLVALSAMAGGDKAAKVDGTWMLIDATGPDGNKLPPDAIKKYMPVGVFKDGKYTLSFGGKVVESGTYKTDATKKPATIDMSIEEGNPKEKGMTELGIYKIEGDTLTMASSKAGSKTRPTKFEGGNGVGLQILKRSK